MGERSLSALRRLAGESFSDGWRVAPNEKNAPVDSPAPANGMTLRDFPTPEACRRSRSEFVVIVRDPEHYLPGRLIIHLLGQDTRFLGSLLPVFGVVEMRGIGHSQTITRAASDRVRSYRYPITLTCFLFQLKSGLTSAPRLRSDIYEVTSQSPQAPLSFLRP